MLNRERETNAVCASRVFPTSTKDVNVAKVTWKIEKRFSTPVYRYLDHVAVMNMS